MELERKRAIDQQRGQAERPPRSAAHRARPAAPRGWRRRPGRAGSTTRSGPFEVGRRPAATGWRTRRIRPVARRPASSASRRGGETARSRPWPIRTSSCRPAVLLSIGSIVREPCSPGGQPLALGCHPRQQLGARPRVEHDPKARPRPAAPARRPTRGGGTPRSGGHPSRGPGCSLPRPPGAPAGRSGRGDGRSRSSRGPSRSGQPRRR